ncbi:hypothetical protein ACFVRU_00245 [Streptomyces sp. NPDC057927]
MLGVFVLSPGRAEALREQVAEVLAPLGLRLSAEKTRVVHIDDGFKFLGHHSAASGNVARASDTSTPGPPRRLCRP